MEKGKKIEDDKGGKKGTVRPRPVASISLHSRHHSSTPNSVDDFPRP